MSGSRVPRGVARALIVVVALAVVAAIVLVVVRPQLTPGASAPHRTSAPHDTAALGVAAIAAAQEAGTSGPLSGIEFTGGVVGSPTVKGIVGRSSRMRVADAADGAALATTSTFTVTSTDTKASVVVAIPADGSSTRVALDPGTYTVAPAAPTISDGRIYTVQPLDAGSSTVTVAAPTTKDPQQLAPVGFDVAAATPPLHLEIAEVGSTSVDLAWEAGVDVASYVLRRTSGDVPAKGPGDGDAVALGSATATAASAVGLSATTTYTFTLFGTSTAGAALPIASLTTTTGSADDDEAAPAFAYASNTLLVKDVAALDPVAIGTDTVSVRLSAADVDRASTDVLPGVSKAALLQGACIPGSPFISPTTLSTGDAFFGVVQSCAPGPNGSSTAVIDTDVPLDQVLDYLDASATGSEQQSCESYGDDGVGTEATPRPDGTCADADADDPTPTPTPTDTAALGAGTTGAYQTGVGGADVAVLASDVRPVSRAATPRPSPSGSEKSEHEGVCAGAGAAKFSLNFGTSTTHEFRIHLNHDAHQFRWQFEFSVTGTIKPSVDVSAAITCTLPTKSLTIPIVAPGEGPVPVTLHLTPELKAEAKGAVTLTGDTLKATAGYRSSGALTLVGGHVSFFHPSTTTLPHIVRTSDVCYLNAHDVSLAAAAPNPRPTDFTPSTGHTAAPVVVDPPAYTAAQCTAKNGAIGHVDRDTESRTYSLKAELTVSAGVKAEITVGPEGGKFFNASAGVSVTATPIIATIEPSPSSPLCGTLGFKGETAAAIEAKAWFGSEHLGVSFEHELYKQEHVDLYKGLVEGGSITLGTCPPGVKY